jgi:polyhydroxyalkanoate synthesis regulator phasin
VGTDYKKLDDILDKDFRSTVDNKKLAIRSGMVDENGNITALKKSLIELQREFDANSSY